MKIIKTYRRHLFLILLLFPNLCFSQNSYRDNYTQPEKIMDTVGIKPGMIVGEAGAGEGYFTFWLSKRVGEHGKIFANDIDKNAVKKINNRCKEEDIVNIQTGVGEVADPLFPVDTLDFVIMMSAFHDFAKPIEWMKNVTNYLKPNARLVIIDRDPQKTGSGDDHFLSKEKVLDIMKKTDFDLVDIKTFLQRDNIYIFKLTRK